MNTTQLNTGVVVIGRNEGLRLVRCLESVSDFYPRVVYVDSASTDNSLADAKKLGSHVISLDMTQAFTAARARNKGFETIISLFPEVQFIQFVDGDCIVNKDWIELAADFLVNNPTVAVVCGRRREVSPQRSIYNRMCDEEWNTKLGNTKSCGGDALVRVDVMKQIGGYRNSLIAGEEPELCIRIRQAGYMIWRLDIEMTLHDAAITQFNQWWKRTMRGGYAYAEGVSIHGNYPELHWVKESTRAWVWGFILPLIILLMLFLNWKLSLILMMVYPLQIIRLVYKNQKEWSSAFFLVLGKFAEAIGQIKFLKKHYLNEKIHLIEYK